MVKWSDGQMVEWGEALPTTPLLHLLLLVRRAEWIAEDKVFPANPSGGRIEALSQIIAREIGDEEDPGVGDGIERRLGGISLDSRDAGFDEIGDEGLAAVIDSLEGPSAGRDGGLGYRPGSELV